MSGISSHVLDTSLGKPAAAVSVSLALLQGDTFVELGRGVTDADGRIKHLLGEHALTAGLYRLRFEIGAHYRASGRPTFYEQVEIQFHVSDPSQHYHVPLLSSPFGYSTYRGS